MRGDGRYYLGITPQWRPGNVSLAVDPGTPRDYLGDDDAGLAGQWGDIPRNVEAHPHALSKVPVRYIS